MKFKVLSVTVALVILAIFLSYSINRDEVIDLKASNGEGDIIDGFNWDEQLLSLEGEWKYYHMELLDPTNPKPNGETLLINIPCELSSIEEKIPNFSSDFYGTLVLEVDNLDVNQFYAIKLKYFASASTIFINGNEIAKAGNVGDDKNHKTQYIPIEESFKTESSHVTIMIYVSNYHHRRVRFTDVLIGSHKTIKEITFRGIIADSFKIGSLFMLFLYHFIIIYIYRREKYYQYFTILVLVNLMRSSIVNERILVRIYPYIHPEIMMKIGYIAPLWLFPLVILYIEELLEDHKLKIFKKVSYTVMASSFLLVALFSIKTYDFIFEYATVILFILSIVFLVFCFVRRTKEKEKEFFITFIGLLIIYIASISDFLRELDLIEAPERLSTGVLIFVLSQAFFVAWKLNDIHHKEKKFAEETTKMYDEIEVLNRELERKIENRTKELKQMNEKLSNLAKIDPLTSLPNRRYFDERIYYEWEKSLEEKTIFSILMLDIDRFKNYNDYYGHLKGDECLEKIAAIIKKCLSIDDYFAARYGGEEFVVLLPNTSKEKSMVVAELLRKAVLNLRIPNESYYGGRYVTISIGANSSQIGVNDSIDDFINRADKAMYFAKRSGRNRSVHIFDEEEV